jgi:salicylate hydroxylase
LAAHSSRSKSLDIAVCGCGPAGLAAALLLHRAGHRVTLIERFTEPQPVGSGLLLQPAGLAVLAALDLVDNVLQLGTPIERLLGRSVPANRVALDVRYSALGAGCKAIGIHRAALFDVLYRAVVTTGIRIVGGQTVVAIDIDPQRMTVIAATGERQGPYELIVDALGANSPLALDKAKRRVLEYGALWVNVPWPYSGFDSTRLEQRYRFAEQMCGVLPIGKPSLQHSPQAAFFWSLKRSQLATWRERGLGAWRKDIAQLWPQAAALIDSVATTENVTFAQYDHFTQRVPFAHRLAHIGDSAHATSPQLGQGANMALLDAYALATALARNIEIDSALRDYASMRRWHVRLFQLASRMFTPFYQSDSRTLAFVRDWIAAPLSRMPIGDRIVARLVSGMTTAPLAGVRFKPYRMQ